MGLNSFTFLLGFLPVLLLLMAAARRVGQGQAVLVLASLLFYGWGRPEQLAWLAGSILFNAAVARAMDRSRSRGRWLLVGLAGNLTVLGLLKYARFACEGLALAGLHLPAPDWVLPLGISFFTLQQVMYLVDVYEGLAPAHGLAQHASFVAFFPVLALGPLTRSRALLPQLREGGRPDYERAAQGLLLVACGLVKKAFLAEALAALADPGFAAPGRLSLVEAWLASLAYSLQIYFDFSGYSDLAVGVGLLLGIRLPENFRAPFRATSIIDFWQRWHITLSQFITTYLYTPILRRWRRPGPAASAVATLAAMAIAGLWHGAAWTFVAFGLIHGAALALNQLWRKRIKLRLGAAAGWALTLLVVNAAFVVFRADSFGAALALFKAMLPHGQPLLGTWILHPTLPGRLNLGICLVAAGAALVGPDSNAWAVQLRPGWRSAAAVAGLLLLGALYLNSSTTREFIYFRF